MVSVSSRNDWRIDCFYIGHFHVFAYILFEETEKKIQDAMTNLMKNRTSLIIAHRLSTIQDADVIVVMDNGRVVETGKHESLLAAKGRYYELYMTQFAGKAI